MKRPHKILHSPFSILHFFMRLVLLPGSVFGILEPTRAGEFYYTNFNITAINFTVPYNYSADMLEAESARLTNIVVGAGIVVNSNETSVIESEGVALGYLDADYTAADTWIRARGSLQPVRTYPGEVRQHVGWVRGTKLVEGEWSAFLWTAQNRIVFKSSATNAWQGPESSVAVDMLKVIVGSLGIYDPLKDVNDLGPDLSKALNTVPGAGDEGDYLVDISNVFYAVRIPYVWVWPQQAFACAGGSNVGFIAQGSDIPGGVDWTLYPSNFEGHAELAASGNQATVTPGNMVTNYKVRATSKDNTNFYDEADLIVVKVDIESLKFNSDHGLLRDNVSDFEDTGILYPEPEWKPSRTNYPNAPISHTWDANVNATLSVTVSPSGASLPYTLSGDGPGTHLDFAASGVLVGGVNTITMSSLGNIPAVISRYAGGPITWTLELAGVCTIMTNTGPHKMYVTAGTPYGSVITEKRMEWVTTTCNDDTTAHGCAADILYKTGAYRLGSQLPDPIWLIAGGTDGECIDLATFYKAAVEFLGWPSGSVVFIYPTLGLGSKESNSNVDYEIRADDNAVMYFLDGHNPPGENYYEAAFKYTVEGATWYYAGGVGIYLTPQECMNDICKETRWALPGGGSELAESWP